MKKRLLALTLTVVMVLTSFMGSITTLAEGQSTEEALTETEVKASSVLSDAPELPEAWAIPPTYRTATPIDATSGVTFDQLDDDHIKLVGRTTIEDTDLRISFCGTGFKVHVNAPQATNVIFDYTCTWAFTVNFIIDGEDTLEGRQTSKGRTGALASGSSENPVNGQFIVPIPAGEHAIEVVMDSQMERLKTEDQAARSDSFFHFTKIQFDGSIIGREEDKDFYFEVVGDSITGGCASLAAYEPGKLGDNLKYNKASSSYAYYLGNMIDADISNVSLGGLGLTATASHEDVSSKEPQLDDIYPYQDYNDMWNKKLYDFSKERTPDMVLLTIGANDGSSYEYALNDWKAEAKAMLQMVKRLRGDVPILWVNRAGKPYQYIAIRQLIEEDPDIKAYGNIYCTPSLYYDGNGRGTIYTQTSGHPDPSDQFRGAQRLYDAITREGIVDISQPAVTTEYVYYVSENGDDGASGMSGEPLKTIAGAIAKAKSDVTPFATDGVLHIYVDGAVDLTGNTQAVGGVTTEATLVKRADDSLLPIVIETKDFNGTDKATLNLSYALTSDGNGWFYSLQPITFRNVKFYGVNKNAGGNAAINKYSGMNVKTVFDNVEFGNALNSKWTITTAPFTYRDVLEGAIKGQEEAEGVIEFRNMNLTADEFANITPCSVGSIWRSEGSITSAPNIKSTIIFGKGATVDGSLVRFVTGGLALGETSIEMHQGSKMTNFFKGTYTGATDNPYVYNTPMSFFIYGGKVDVEYFHMLGGNVTLNGDLNFNMAGGEIYTIGTGNASGYLNSILLGGGASRSTINGDVTNTIDGGLIFLTDANTESSSIFSGGGGAYHTVTGNLTNNFYNGNFYISGLGSSASGMYLAHGDGAIQGKLINNLYGGIYDLSSHRTSSSSSSGSGAFYLGGKNVQDAIYRMETTIGQMIDEGKKPGIGPQFFNIIFHNGSQYGEVGVKEYQAEDFTETVPDEDVVTFTLNGANLPGGYMVCTPNAVKRTTGTAAGNSFVAGNARVIINDGKISGSIGVSNQVVTSLGGKIVLFSGNILGSADAAINGGCFQSIYGTDTTEGTPFNIGRGLTLNISNATSYSGVQNPSQSNKKYCDVWPVGVATIGAPTDGSAAVKMTIADSKLDNIHLNAKGSMSVINGSTSYSIDSGLYQSVTVSNTMPGAAVSPAISGGSYATSVDNALLKNGYELADSEVTGYRYDVVPEGTGTLHAGHCFCGGNCETATAANGHTCVTDPIDWQPLAGTGTIPAVSNSTSYYFLKDDFELTGQCTLAANQKLYICLNGHELSRKGKLFLVGLYGDAELHICDCSKEKTGTAIDTDTAWDNIAGFCQGYDFSKAGTTKTLIELYGGTIIASVIGERTGGAIHLSTGNVFNMYGGTIKPNTAALVSKTKGQVYVGEKAVMNMYGGTIEGGRSEANGANLYIAGTVNMKGGLIDDAQSTAAGANIYVQSSTSVLNMSGGTIQNGKSNGVGGNILTNGIIRMTGGTIQGGTGSDIYSGNIYANGTTAKFYLSGGEIKNGGTEVRGCNELALSGSIKISNLCLDYMDSSAPNTVYRIGDESGYKALDSDAAINLGFCIVNGGSSIGPDRVVFKDGTADDVKKFTCSNTAKKLVAATKNTVTGLYLEDKALEEHKHCFCGNCETATTKNGHTCDSSIVWTPLTGTTIQVTENTTAYYYLSGDVNLTGQCTLAANQKIYICLNGHKLTRNGKLFLVGNKGDAELHICDCSSDHSGIIKNTDIGWANHSAFAQGYSKDGSSALIEVYGGTIIGSVGKADVNGGGLVNVVTNTTFNLYGGSLQWNTEQTTTYNPQGLVSVTGNGVMNMYGGTISGGRTTGNGANVYIGGTGKVNMYGGTIKDGQAKAAGNIYMNGATTVLNIYDGATIANGTATSFGGNIGAWNGGTVHMYGGLVENGVAASYGGNLGASHDTGATKALVIDDGIIRGGESKSSYGGNICWNAAITVNDGEISGGKANKSGGNIYGMNGIALVTINGGTIKDGQTEVYGGNVYSCGKIAITGGEITGGYAKSSGGNVALEVLTRENSLEISGGTIKDGKITNSNGANVFVKAPKSTVTVSGGTISGGTSVYTGPNFYVSEAAKVEITGTDQAMPIFEEGTVTGTGNKLVNNIVIADGIETRISGGKFNAPNGYCIYLRGEGYETTSVTGGYFIGTPIVADGSKPVISGGYFTSKPAAKYIVTDDDEKTADYFVKDLGDAVVTDIEGDEYRYTIGYGYKVNIKAAVLTGDLISVAGLAGAGYYEANEAVELSAFAESNGYRFAQWMNGADVLDSSNEFKLTDNLTEHMTITAMYRFGEEKVSLTLKAPEKGVVKVTNKSGLNVENTEDATLSLTELDRGEFTIEFTGDAKNFRGWTNENGSIVSKNAVYTFDLNVATTLTPVYDKASEVTVVFSNGSGQILRVDRNIENYETYAAPTPVVRAGYETTWVFTEDQVAFSNAELELRAATLQYIEVTPRFTPAANQDFKISLYKVVIETTTPELADLTKTTLLKAYDAKVGAPMAFDVFEPGDGESFTGIYDAEGKLVSASTNMSIRPISKEKDTFYVVYTTGTPIETKPTAAITDVAAIDQLGDGSKYALSVTATFNTPKEFEVVEAGFIYIPDFTGTYADDSAADAALFKGATGVYAYVSWMQAGTGTVTLNLKNMSKETWGDKKFFLKGYLIYKDQDGVEGIIYSDMASTSLNEILGE